MRILNTIVEQGAKQRAAIFINHPDVAPYLRAYDCGSAADPLLLAFLVGFYCPNEIVFLVQDWGLEPEATDPRPNGVNDNVVYTQQYFNNNSHAMADYSYTFQMLFHG